jgi:hypothetical protein
MTHEEERRLKIEILEMEVGFLTTVRRSPNPAHSVVAGKLELERRAEVERLKAGKRQPKPAVSAA